MVAENTVHIESSSRAIKIADILAFAKLRLSLLVIISAILGYLIEAKEFSWFTLLGVFAGGLLITSASNGINQILERDLDKLMKRTMSRPLPMEKMTVKQATILVIIMGIAGTVILLVWTNLLCTLLSLSSLLIYSFIYTPMKRRTPIAVFVGAIPGALPPLLGCVAASGEISFMAMLLFAIQFMWQFPHFWAIAWKLDDDYKKAGFNLLPYPTGHSKQNAFQILVYNLMLIPVSALPWIFEVISPIAGALVICCSILFAIPAVRLYIRCDMKSATQLMFASFVYLPITQLIILFNP